MLTRARTIVCPSVSGVLIDSMYAPRTWKSSTVIPVPKKLNVKQMNDFRPAALTSILAKCMERIVCNQLVAARMDPPTVCV